MANNYNKINRMALLENSASGVGEYSIEEQKKLTSFMSRSLQNTGIQYAINFDTDSFNRDTNRWYKSMVKYWI